MRKSDGLWRRQSELSGVDTHHKRVLMSSSRIEKAKGNRHFSFNRHEDDFRMGSGTGHLHDLKGQVCFRPGDVLPLPPGVGSVVGQVKTAINPARDPEGTVRVNTSPRLLSRQVSPGLVAENERIIGVPVVSASRHEQVSGRIYCEVVAG